MHRRRWAAAAVVLLLAGSACQEPGAAGPPCNQDGVCDPGLGETYEGCFHDCREVCDHDCVCEYERGETSINCSDCGHSPCHPCEPIIEFWYLVSELRLPVTREEAAAVGFDLDDDGTIDNKLGHILETFTPDGVDINGIVNGAIQRGELLILIQLRMNSLSDGAWVCAELLRGEAHDASPLFDGLDVVKVREELPWQGSTWGSVSSGVLEAGPFRGSIREVLPGAGERTFPVESVRVMGSADDPAAPDHLGSLTLGGGIAATELRAALMPLIVHLANREMQDDLYGAWALRLGLLLDGTCMSSIEGCTWEEPGQGECVENGVITWTEVRCSSSLPTADVDSDGDGARDLVSFGLQVVRAVPVTIAP